MALSGGGFRAAFFHVGVLARLAELDLLGEVRMLSCVSGGSLAGAIYYLTLLSKLAPDEVVDASFVQSMEARKLTQDELRACVRETYAHLQHAARSNIRALVFKNPLKNGLMFLSSAYSRTDRAGDMLDRHLYRQVLRTEARLWVSRRQLELRNLHVVSPHVPRLVLNATTLNSGHAWQFRTDGMGERLLAVAQELDRPDLDRNDRFEFTSYTLLPPHQANFPLGLAVAASACFPGLFRPLPISGLYPKTRVDLMDGGAQDNQGVQALLDEHLQRPFSRVIVSDGAGQLEDERVKGRLVPAVIQRVISLQGDRIREEQLLSAWHRLVKDEKKAFDVVDLRQGIKPRTLRPGKLPSDPEPPERDIRESLARIRTDLDAFARRESTLLVARGFRTAASLGGPTDANCPFLDPTVGAELDDPRDVTFAVLERARRQLFKPWLYWLAVAAAAIPLLGYALYGVYRAGPGGRPEVRMWLAFVAFLLLPPALTRTAFFWVKWHQGLGRWLVAGAIYAGLLVSAPLVGPVLDERLGMSWSHLEATLLAASFLLLPAVAPCLVWLLLAPEGRAWRRFAQ